MSASPATKVSDNSGQIDRAVRGSQGPESVVGVVRDAWAGAVRWGRARDRRWLAAAIVAAALANIVYAAVRAARVGPSDLVWGFLGPTREILFEGKNPALDHVGNAYSPFFYALMTPLAVLPNAAASVAWSVFNLAALVAIAGLVTALLRKAWAPEKLVLPAWSFVLAAPLVVDNIDLGQANVLSLLFVCCAVYTLAEGREVRGGLWLSAAIAWKLTPGILLFHLGLRRQWRALASCALGLVACLWGVPSIVFGPIRSAQFVRGWARLVVEPVLFGGQPGTINVGWTPTNQSLDAFVHRSFTEYGRETFGGLHNWLDPASLSELAVDRLSLGLKVVLLLVLAAVSRSRANKALPFEVSLMLVAALFLSPVSWYSHFIALLVPYAVTLQALTTQALDLGNRRFMTSAIAISVLLVAVSLTPAIRSYSLVFLGQLPLFAAMAIAARRSARSPSMTFEMAHALHE